MPALHMRLGNGYGYYASTLARYADTVGLANIMRGMGRFARWYQPDAWEPAPLLSIFAADGKNFSGWNKQ